MLRKLIQTARVLLLRLGRLEKRLMASPPTPSRCWSQQKTRNSHRGALEPSAPPPGPRRYSSPIESEARKTTARSQIADIYHYKVAGMRGRERSIAQRKTV